MVCQQVQQQDRHNPIAAKVGVIVFTMVKHWTNSEQIPTSPGNLRVGCIGGGQLGRMMALEAPRLNITMSFIDPGGNDCPAAAAAGIKSKVIVGKLDDEEKLRELASQCDIVTCEIEHIGADVLERMEEEGVNVQPSGRVVKIIQDKLLQKVGNQSYDNCSFWLK